MERDKKEATTTGTTLEVQNVMKSIRSCTNKHSTHGLGDILKRQDSTTKRNFFKGYANEKENKNANMIGDAPFEERK